MRRGVYIVTAQATSSITNFQQHRQPRWGRISGQRPFHLKDNYIANNTAGQAQDCTSISDANLTGNTIVTNTALTGDFCAAVGCTWIQPGT